MTIITNWYPFEEPVGGPNYYKFGDDVLYEINIDNVGDAQAHIKYQFRFSTKVGNGNTFLYNTGPVESIDSANLNVKQTYDVTKIVDGSDNPSCHRSQSTAGKRRREVNPQLRGSFERRHRRA